MAGTLLVTSDRAKNSEAMLIPLSPLATSLIAAMPGFAGPYIFSSSGGQSPIRSFSHAKKRLDAALAERGKAIPAWVLHDFRRCCRSGLGRLGVAPVVAELCLGHAQHGIAAVYDRYSYLDEKRDALRRWEAHLLSVVAPPPDAGEKVVAMPAKRARAWA